MDNPNVKHWRDIDQTPGWIDLRLLDIRPSEDPCPGDKSPVLARIVTADLIQGKVITSGATSITGVCLSHCRAYGVTFLVIKDGKTGDTNWIEISHIQRIKTGL